MSKLEKLLKKIKNNPRQVRFAELDKILLRAGFKRRQPQGGSSHYIYSKGSKQITVPYAQPHIKVIYVERALELLEGEMDANE
ncbi:MAG: toxin HicA [Syntrophomonas sp.]|nr:toxin HicA [Syntrophomonas sp.]